MTLEELLEHEVDPHTRSHAAFMATGLPHEGRFPVGTNVIGLCGYEFTVTDRDPTTLPTCARCELIRIGIETAMGGEGA